MQTPQMASIEDRSCISRVKYFSKSCVFRKHENNVEIGRKYLYQKRACRRAQFRFQKKVICYTEALYTKSTLKKMLKINKKETKYITMTMISNLKFTRC